MLLFPLFPSLFPLFSRRNQIFCIFLWMVSAGVSFFLPAVTPDPKPDPSFDEPFELPLGESRQSFFPLSPPKRFSEYLFSRECDVDRVSGHYFVVSRRTLVFQLKTSPPSRRRVPRPCLRKVSFRLCTLKFFYARARTPSSSVLPMLRFTSFVCDFL